MQGVVAMAAGVVLSAAGTVAAVHLMRRRAAQRDDVVLGVLAPSLAGLHMLIIAFALAAGWQSVMDAGAAAEEEATQAVELYWAAREMPAPVARAVQDDVRAYLLITVRDEWPRMRHGELGDGSARRLDQVRLRLLGTATGDDDDLAQARLTALERLRDLAAAHDARAGLAGSRLPGLLVLGVVALSLIMIVFPLVAGLDGTRRSLLWAVLAAALFAVGALVVLQFERPYGGAMGVDAGSLADAREKIVRIDGYPPVPPPGRRR